MRNVTIMALVAIALLAVTVYDQEVGHPSAVGFAAMMLGIAVIVAALVYVAMPPWLVKCCKIDNGRLWLHMRVPRAAQRMASTAQNAPSR